jgi:hypothetical protein
MQIPLRITFRLSLKTEINLHFIYLEMKFVTHRQHPASIRKTSRLRLYTEIIAAYREIYATIVTALYGQTAEFASLST